MAAKIASNQPKHGVFVYSKLKSHERASSAVQKLLKDVCKSIDNIEVKPYSEQYKLEDYLGVTAVVVIDSQQTRAVITPVRRDGNLDHWDDLKILSSTRTSPPGSTLIVIYGDESSKDGNDLLATKWLQVWQYNDPRSFRIAKENTIFSIFNEFNEKQKESIKHYLRMVPLYPSITGKEMNILFLSPRPERKQMKQFMDNNPFVVQQTVKKCSNCQALTFSSYIQLKDSFSEQTSAASLKVHYRDYPIINLRVEKSLENVLKKILDPMKPDSQVGKCSECRSFPPVFDRLIYCCNAREPFQISNQTKFRLEMEQLKRELECFNLRLRGETFSIIKDEQKNDNSDSTNGLASSVTRDDSKENYDSRRSVILFLKRQSKEPFADQREKTLQEIDDDSLCRSHVYHLMQSPTLLEPKLSLDRDEMETMKKEKEAVERDIKLLETKLRLKKARASDLEKKLTGKGEGWSWFKPSSWRK